jgi:hypothetical protein
MTKGDDITCRCVFSSARNCFPRSPRCATGSSHVHLDFPPMVFHHHIERNSLSLFFSLRYDPFQIFSAQAPLIVSTYTTVPLVDKPRRPRRLWTASSKDSIAWDYCTVLTNRIRRSKKSSRNDGITRS